MSINYAYKVGGSLSANDPTYVTRAADGALAQGIQQGRFCYVFGPRQVGKSSLRIRTRHQLEARGHRCAAVQATDISLMVQASSSAIASSAWDKQLIALIWDSLYPSESATIVRWLEATARLSAQRRLEHFARDLLFPSLRSQPLTIFIDEIDYLLAIPEAVHELLHWIAKCYSLRDHWGEYQPLSFVMLGSTTLSTLAEQALAAPSPGQDCSNRAAENHAIAHLLSAKQQLMDEITLGNFNLHETQPLQQGFVGKFSSPVAPLQSLFRWTNGQPFLTQKLCKIMAERAQGLSATTLQQISTTATQLDQWIDLLVQNSILHNWPANDDPIHLMCIRDRLQQSPRSQALNALYQRVARGDRIAANGSALQAELLIIGLVICEHQQLRPANPIYQHVFAERARMQPSLPLPFSVQFSPYAASASYAHSAIQQTPVGLSQSLLDRAIKGTLNSVSSQLMPLCSM